MQVINLTPHEVKVKIEEGMYRIFPPSGEIVRLQVLDNPSKIDLQDIPTVTIGYGEAIGLPPEMNNVFYLVSDMVRTALPHRLDLLSPDSGPSAIRNSRGQIEAVVRFKANI